MIFTSKYAAQYAAADAMKEVIYAESKPVTAEMLTEICKAYVHEGPNFIVGQTIGEYILKQLEGK